MSNLAQLKESFNQLEPWAKDLFIFQLLFDGDISYVELSKQYVAALEKQREVEAKKLNGSSRWLGFLWKKIPSTNKFARAASAYAILQSGIYRSAPIEKEFKKYLEENPYDEDENGFPKTKLRSK